jgi:Skp family chaperone for outer membrane proteins
MKLNSLIAAAMFLAAITISPINAQQPAAARPAAAAPAASSVAVTGDAKIALIDTGAFTDEKAGITRYVNAIKGVNREFEPRQTELKGLRDRYQAIVDEVNKLNSSNTTTPIDQKTVQSKVDQAEVLKKDIERKTEDANAAYNRRLNEVLGPIHQDIARSIDAFAKTNGIHIILDSGKLQDAGVILVSNPSVDITSAFIADYNKKNPVAAAAK